MTGCGMRSVVLYITGDAADLLSSALTKGAIPHWRGLVNGGHQFVHLNSDHELFEAAYQEVANSMNTEDLMGHLATAEFDPLAT